MVQEQRIEDCFSEAFEYLQPEELKMNAASITVFPQMFSLPAAAAVLGTKQETARHTVLYPLLRTYLIKETEGHKYYMHSVVRDFVKKLSSNEYKDAIRSAIQRFMNYYIRKLQEAGKKFWKNPVLAQKDLDRDWQNF